MSTHPDLQPGGDEYVPCHAPDVSALKMSMDEAETLSTKCPRGHQRKLHQHNLCCIVKTGTIRPTHCPYFGSSAITTRTDHH